MTPSRGAAASTARRASSRRRAFHRDRVHHGVRTDVVQHDRCPPCGDLPGETQTGTHPDALPDLVLETVRRSGHEAGEPVPVQQRIAAVSASSTARRAAQPTCPARRTTAGRAASGRRSDRRHHMVIRRHPRHSVRKSGSENTTDQSACPRCEGERTVLVDDKCERSVRIWYEALTLRPAVGGWPSARAGRPGSRGGCRRGAACRGRPIAR